MYTRATTVYISAIVICGVVAIALAAANLHLTDPSMMTVLAALTILASTLKIKVPGVDGNVSLSFVPIVMSTVLVSLPESILLTAGAALIQSTVFVKKFDLVRAAFNCAALTVSVACAGMSCWLLQGRQSPLAQMVISACVYYVVNSALVTIVVGLSCGKALAGIWNDCLGLYLPYFAAGIACAMVTISGVPVDENRKIMQSPAFILLPSLLLVRQYFKVATLRAAR